MKKCKVALVGISGFGEINLKATKRLEEDCVVCIKAICEVNYESNKETIEELKAKGVIYYQDYKEMLKKEVDLDYVVVSTPIHLHRDMAVSIMESGMNVLLEKPPAVTIQDVNAIIETSDKTGKLCAVDFLLTSGKAFLDLKNKIRKGEFGQIKTITGQGLWKRLDSYYERTAWAGKLVFNNKYVLDGTLNNPFAHLLNNMLQLADAAKAFPIKAVTAELYHGHNIEAEDTSCVKIETASGTDLFFYATLCSNVDQTPCIIVEGISGRAIWNYNNELDIYKNGELKKKRYKEEDFHENIHRNLCNVISGTEKKLFCSIEETRNFVLASNGAFESSKEIHPIASKYINSYENEGSIETDIESIVNVIEKCENDKKLFSEIGMEWAIRGERLSMEGYKEFNMFK